MTGTCADRTTAEVTEPKCIPAYPPRPPLPRTTSWALLDSSTSQRSGTSQTSRLLHLHVWVAFSPTGQSLT